jgi:hypothetical protein
MAYSSRKNENAGYAYRTDINTSKCLEVKCRAMQNAIIANTFPLSREDGWIVTDASTPFIFSKRRQIDLTIG